MQYQIFDRFYKPAQELRQIFDRRFADPLQMHAHRFLWDYWHVPGEYTLLRTPAYNYFPAKIYQRFHRHLVAFGRSVLGCHDVSPPWLSCYVEGCRQEAHQDVPHGPLAFVYSLTPSPRAFRGGETFIQRPRARIAPDFNRLILFNPSLVHGVTPVRGTFDPREGRLVVHGWFVQPRPFWTGPLQVEELREVIEGQLPAAGSLGPGLLSLRIRIRPSGQVEAIQVLLSTLASDKGLTAFLTALKMMRFARHASRTVLTLPLIFQ